MRSVMWSYVPKYPPTGEIPAADVDAAVESKGDDSDHHDSVVSASLGARQRALCRTFPFLR